MPIVSMHSSEISNTQAAYEEVLSVMGASQSGGNNTVERRPSQEKMLVSIAEALSSRESIVIEAGTGSGKSFAYLIPAIIHQRDIQGGLNADDGPIVISTGTIALQEQLVHKDIPFLLQALGLEETMKARLVKGRSNYLCIQKMDEWSTQVNTHPKQKLFQNVLVSALADGWDGDQANLDFALPKDIWEEMASETDDCLGSKCQYFRENPYRLAREHLDKASLIITNHALYLQDLVSGHSLLPPHHTVIFDEAHHLKRAALQALTVRIGKLTTSKLLQKIQRHVQAIPEDLMTPLIHTQAGLLEWVFRHNTGGGQKTSRFYPDSYWMNHIDKFQSYLSSMLDWLSGIDVAQIPLFESDLDRDRATVRKAKYLQQLDELILRWGYFTDTEPHSPRVNWMEVDSSRLHFELKSTPLDVATHLHDLLWQQKQAIFTSATLAVNRSNQYFIQDLGLPKETQSLILASPFQYDEQCVYYIPSNMPEPSHPDYTTALIVEAERLLRLNQGSSFVLSTSYDTMNQMAEALIPKLPFECRVQGELPRHRLLEWFKTTPNSILFATATFWEGIDVPGSQLSCVIIDKLPFSHPDDPVNQALIDRVKASGGDWFNNLVLPQAIIRLKQGVGRLIRRKDDHGIVALLDPRIHSKGYGRKILSSLPPAPVITQWDGLCQWHQKQEL